MDILKTGMNQNYQLERLKSLFFLIKTTHFSLMTDIYISSIRTHPAFDLFDSYFRCTKPKRLTPTFREEFKLLLFSKSIHNEQLNNLVTNYYDKAYDCCVKLYP